MIIVALRGGLGNQLFQYALGRTLAVRNRTELKLDTSSYQGKRAPRKLGLENFNIKATIATKGERNALTKVDRSPIIKRLNSQIQLRLPYTYKDVIEEKRNHRFDPEIHRLRGNKYLIGYWQSEKYFQEIDPILRGELTPRTRLSEQTEAVARLISQVSRGNK